MTENNKIEFRAASFNVGACNAQSYDGVFGYFQITPASFPWSLARRSLTLASPTNFDPGGLRC